MTRLLRDAMSHFATGVTVVTTHFEGQDYGMTCNSFSTVSLEPALVLWSIRKESHSHAAFTDRTLNGKSSGGYTVSVLASHQQAAAMQFTQGTQAERFQNIDIERCHSHRPRISGAVAWFDCQLDQVLTAGDHDILIGRVLDFGSHEGESLVYSQRHFGTFKQF
jgi:3-hydroxy-9,10-secoandrosta-1,3,5(10)-triene-9,17-dione monooxygenase reductase component